MNNSTESLSSSFAEELSNLKISTAVFLHNGRRYIYNHPDTPKEKKIHVNVEDGYLSGFLSSSGSSWDNEAYLFAVADCAFPCLYIQFGSSFEDAYESFCDNEPSLLIPESDYADYDLHSENPTCQFTSDGKPIDTDNVQGFGPLTLENITFTQAK